MKRLIEFPLEEGGSIFVEVEQMDQGGMENASNIVERSRQTFSQALEKVQPIAETIISNLSSLSKRPDEIQVVFGLKMSTEVGAFVAAAGGEANYEITLTWKCDHDEQLKQK